jgi:hypothetical protein
MKIKKIVCKKHFYRSNPPVAKFDCGAGNKGIITKMKKLFLFSVTAIVAT